MSQSLLFDSETIKSISSPSCSPGLVSNLLARPTIQSSVVVAAVGLGKTAIMASLAQRWPTGRVMMISHRFELNQQAIKEFEFVCREPVDLEQAMYRADQRGTPHRIVVASVQTLVSMNKRKRRFEKFNPNDFGLLLIDEGHRATAASYRQIIAHFQQNPSLKMVLVTATPDRSDKVGLACVADNVTCNYDILWGVQNGWLCPPKQKFYHLHELHLDDVRTVGGDLDPRQLAHQLEQEKNLHGIAVAMVDECGKDDQSIVFCASVPQAERVAQLLRDYHERKFGTSDRTIAISLSGKLSPQDPIRRNLIKQFRNGEIQHLVNMQVACEGFNAPNVKVIGMGRPTKSRALYQQSIGRGSRTLPGVVDGLDTPEERLAAIKESDKPHFTVIDFIGQASRHELSCTFDFMAGEEPPDICDAAKRIAKRPDFNGNTLDAIKQAKAEKEAAIELARHRVTAGVSYSLTEEEIYPNTFANAPCPSFLRTVAPSDKQKNMLLKLGYTGPQVAQMNPRSASRAIDHAIKNPKTSFGKWLAKKTSPGK